jgi:hypothetical protein
LNQSRIVAFQAILGVWKVGIKLFDSGVHSWKWRDAICILRVSIYSRSPICQRWTLGFIAGWLWQFTPASEHCPSMLQSFELRDSRLLFHYKNSTKDSQYYNISQNVSSSQIWMQRLSLLFTYKSPLVDCSYYSQHLQLITN